MCVGGGGGREGGGKGLLGQERYSSMQVCKRLEIYTRTVLKLKGQMHVTLL